MQAWPVWLQRRYHEQGLTWRAVLGEGVAVIPRILATRVKVHGKEQPVPSFYYASHRRSRDHNSIEQVFARLNPQWPQFEFKILYIEEIVRESTHQWWYKEILNKVEREVNDFLDNLRRGEISLHNQEDPA